MTDDLKERLRKGIVSESLHEDNETELFDVDAADELCEDALERIVQLETALYEISHLNNMRDRFSSEIDTVINSVLGEKND